MNTADERMIEVTIDNFKGLRSLHLKNMPQHKYSTVCLANIMTAVKTTIIMLKYGKKEELVAVLSKFFFFARFRMT